LVDQEVKEGMVLKDEEGFDTRPLIPITSMEIQEEMAAMVVRVSVENDDSLLISCQEDQEGLVALEEMVGLCRSITWIP
jgi:hypothetical protein